MTQADNALGQPEADAFYRIAGARRDIRNGFEPSPVDDDVLTRVLGAAHQAPSVGLSQPWDFLILRDRAVRERVQRLAQAQRDSYAATLPSARALAFSRLKVEAILESPVNVVVTCDPTRGGRHVLGRHAQPQAAQYSAVTAVQNLWLAARAEGLGVGWVSFFDERALAAALDLPGHVQVVAYLCVGHVGEFPPAPELALSGWARQRPLAWAVHEGRWGRRGLPGTGPASLLADTLAAIRPPDGAAAKAALERQSQLTKPPGSLGYLEDLSARLSGIAGECPPPLPEPAAVAVFAGDHGVHAQHVTPWPQEVTAQMVANFLASTAVVNAIAAQVGAEVCVVDVGVAADLPPAPGLLPRKVRRGTADMTVGQAMTLDEARQAVEAGIETARDLVTAGNRCLLTGDMGIANTTASAALIAAFTGADPAEVTGRGTGVDDQAWARKVDVVRRALALHRPGPGDPLAVLAAVGGLEHAALAGYLLGAAALRVPVVLDGVIACAAALAAAAFSPAATGYMVAGHRSTEPGASRALAALGLRPLLELDLRLGEGSGAVLALPIVASAARVLRDVATFGSAGVSGAEGSTAGYAPPAEGGAGSEGGGEGEEAGRRAPTGQVGQRARPPARGRVLVLGGARSGKSAAAERFLADCGEVEYVATGAPPDASDGEWAARVSEHRRRRPPHWRTTQTLDLERVLGSGDPAPVLIDCLSLWLARVMDECGAWSGGEGGQDGEGSQAGKGGSDEGGGDTAGAGGREKVTARVDQLLRSWRATSRLVVAVSNEVGCGIVPAVASGRLYRDALGRLNALVAADSDEVWFCTAGLPRRLR